MHTTPHHLAHPPSCCTTLRWLLMAWLTLVTPVSWGRLDPSVSFNHSPEVQHFLRTFSARYHVPRQPLEELFKHSHPNVQVLHWIRHPYEAQPWPTYRRHFLTQQRVRQGVACWEAHASVLERVRRHTGVPEAVMLAIVGIESGYGQHTGGFRALDALATLAFTYPPRAMYFRYELTQLLLLAREQHMDPSRMESSYAGALGMPQFMPSSYRRFAVDADHNHQVDLFHSFPDTFASIAHFLHHYGWSPRTPIAERATIEPWQLPNHPLTTHQRFTQRNDGHLEPLDHDEAFHKRPTFLLLPSEQREAMAWRVFSNYDVVLHYNRSPLYVLAVSELAHALHVAYHQRHPSHRHHRRRHHHAHA